MASKAVLRPVGLIAVLLFLIVPAAALAAEPIVGPQDPNDQKATDPWQAGTCIDDGPPLCSIATPGKFAEAAGAHPPVGFTQLIVNKEKVEVLPPLLEFERPVDALHTVRVDIPPGFSVTPQATPWCSTESPSACPPASKVGISRLEATNPSTGLSVELPAADVYNMEPHHGEPARFGFSIAGNDVFLETGLVWEGDYHQHFTIHAHEISIDSIALEGLGLPTLGLGVGELARIARNRLVFDGTAGSGTFLSTPTTCLGKPAVGSPFEHVYSTWLRSDGHADPDPDFPRNSAFVEAKIPYRPVDGVETSPKDCDSIPFDPSISVAPNTAQTDSPSGADVTVNLPETPGAGNQATSHVRSAQMTLPPGMALNPSAATGLAACTDAQFGKGTRNPVACPPASRVGTVEVDTPPLPDGSLTGAVYVGQQLSRDPDSGDLYRIFVTVESARFDVSARLLGKVRANPHSGRLTTIFDDAPLGKVPIPGLPQVPFESFRFKFNGGPRAPLSSPPTCGAHTAATRLTPWSSAQGTIPVGQEGGPSGQPPADRTSAFALAALPGGGPCPQTLAERPFAPGFASGMDGRVSKTFSTLRTGIGRVDGSQELKGVDVSLPPGLTAKLAGVRYCPEAAIAAAAANAGLAERAAPSCPASSRVGVAEIATGTGPAPTVIGGSAYLAGPYKGASLSLAVVTPAAAGPYDLGTVVVRVALHVNPRNAQVRAISDPIPHIYGGAQLSIRSVEVTIDRPGFMLNPTGCKPMAIAGALLGGGGDPHNPAAFAPAGVSSQYQALNCKRLGFKPRLFLRVFGATRRAKNPKFRAVLQTRPGNANIGRAVVTLPPALILDQANIGNVCTRVQFEARKCPKNSIYGHARAFTPLLDGPLKGRVYLRSSDNPLPDLVADLRGQVNIELVGRIDAVRGRIRNTFDVVPDAPVSKFILTMRGGRKGLLVNSRNLCAGKPKAQRAATRAIVRFKAHNSRRANSRQVVRAPCRRQ